MDKQFPVHGAGLGYRRSLMGSLAEHPPSQVNFYEVAPENWIGLGGAMGKQFRAFTEQHDFVCHGLSLSIGSPAPLDVDFVKRVGKFLKQHDIKLYSEHLSYCGDEGHLYDLLPIPFTEDAVKHVVERIQRVQDIIGERIAMENVSYYAAPGQEMSEIEFVNTVLEQADCLLHLDVNNIYVNSINHRYNAEEFLNAMPGDRMAYIHIAGHYDEAEDLIVDTHGSDVIDPVWDLLEKTYERFGVIPTLLERDFNIPPMNELLGEVDKIAELQQKWTQLNDERTVANIG